MSLLSSDTSRTPRKRRYVSPALLSILRLVFRRSDSRDAYVLRLVGNRKGPVLKPTHQDPRRLR